MNTTYTTRGLATFALAALPLAVQAADLQNADTGGTQVLNPMVVTAALAPRTADESLSSVTLLDEATLRRQDPTSLTELFRGQPGVDVSSYGSFGKTSSVSIRGTSSNQSLLMIDGIHLRSATIGAPAWEFLDPRMFERAEIVRGPRGSLYGADAMGGVIQLFTPEGEEGRVTPRISFGGGSFDTQRYSASLSGADGGTRYYFGASRFDSEGAPVRRDGDDKGYDNTSGLVRLSHTYESGAEVGILALRARGNTEFDGGESDYVQQVAGIYGELPVTEIWQSRLTLSESRDELDTFNTAFPSVINTRTQTARWENTLDLSSHQLIVGAEYSEDKVSGTTDYLVDSRDNKAVFTQGLMDFSPLTIQASLRYDDNEAYGDEVNGSLALGYALDDQHTLRASYGTAFRAPTFNDLYYPPASASNPDLEAETSETIELGFRGQYDAWFWDFATYQSDIDQMIALGANYRPFNVDKARIRGVELAAGTELAGWILQAALTYTDPEDRESGNRLSRRASKSLRFDVDRELGDWSLGGSWVAQNHRYEYDYLTGEPTRLDGFGLLNLRAGWEFAPMWSARVTVENALDKEYETAKNYINAGRAAFLSVHFGP